MDGEEEAREYADESAQEIPQPRLWLSALLCSLLLVAELYVLLYDIGGSTNVTSAKPVIAKYVSGVNEVMSKPSGTIIWQAPAPGADLRREDTLLTMSNSQALVQFTDGTELGIEADSLVVLEKTPPEDANQKIVVKLLQGSLAKKAGGNLPVAIDIEDKLTGKRSRIEDDSGKSAFRLASSPDGVSLQVESGSVKLGSGADAKVVGESEQATISGDKVEVRKMPIRFSSLYPEAGHKLARDDEDQRVNLNWRQIASEGGDTSSRLVVSRRPDFKDAEEVDTDTDEQSGKAEYEPKNDGTYFWRLESRDGSVKSPVASFSVVTRAAPKLESDRDIEAIVGQSVFVRWKPIATSRAVIVETSEDEHFSRANRTIARAGQSAVELKFDQPSKLYWRVRADYGPDVGLSPPTETKELLVHPKPLLKPPKVSRPKIRFSGRGKAPRFIFDMLSAVQKGRSVTVELAWDTVAGADQYHLQIADDENFKKVLLDRKLRRTRYDYRVPLAEDEQTLYYRVASIDAVGDEGAFSAPMEIELPALPKPKEPEPLAGPAEPEEPPKKSHWRLDVFGGAAFHSREFKNETNPVSAKGSAMIPMAGGFEYRRVIGQNEDPGALEFINDAWGVLDFGVSVIGEKVEATNVNVLPDVLPASLMRAWLMLERPKWGMGAGLGLYGSTSNKFSWAGRHLSSQRVTLLGVSAELLTSPLDTARHLHWRTQLSLLGVGGLGADLSASGRFMFSVGRAVRTVDQTGLFADLEVLVRYLNIETSFGGVFKLGYSF